MSAVQSGEEECKVAHSACSHMGWADVPRIALESKGSMWVLHITLALFYL